MRVGRTSVYSTDEERISEKIGNVTIERTRGRRFCGERATDAQAVNQPITKTKMKMPKKNRNAD